MPIAVTPQWVINKCGTRLLVASAVELGVTTCILASRDKFISSPLAEELRPNQGPPQEVWEAPTPGVTVANPYFERVPLDSVATFVTDAGPVGAGAVPRLCDSLVRPSDASRLAEMLGGVLGRNDT